MKVVAPDGTVTFVHRAGGGVKRSKLNLHQPSLRRDAKGRVLNDYLRRTRRTHAVVERVARLHLDKLGVRLTRLTDQQAVEVNNRFETMSDEELERELESLLKGTQETMAGLTRIPKHNASKVEDK